MKCPECVTEGERSRVYCGASVTTCMGTHEYYDESGAHHYHDPNVTTTSYSCSRGHVWATPTRDPCPACAATGGVAVKPGDAVLYRAIISNYGHVQRVPARVIRVTAQRVTMEIDGSLYLDGRARVRSVRKSSVFAYPEEPAASPERSKP